MDAPAAPESPPAATPHGGASLAELVGQAHAGDRQAEAALCQRFVPAVRAFARRRLRGVEATEEFTQDAFLLFVQALRSGAVEQPERAGGFLLGICRNLARERARQSERREELWATYGATLEASLPGEIETINPLAIHLEDCFSLLSHRAREVLRLSYAEDQDHEAIARALELSPANARVLRHRSLGVLRECLSKPPSWEAA